MQACTQRRAVRSARVPQDATRCDAHIDRVDKWAAGRMRPLCRHVCTRTYTADCMAHLRCMAAAHVRRPPAAAVAYCPSQARITSVAIRLACHSSSIADHTPLPLWSTHPDNRIRGTLSVRPISPPRRRTAAPIPPLRSASPFPWTAAVGVNMVRGVIRDLDLP